MTVNRTPQVVTIAGSDSGGGAGLQADLKTFQARHVFGMSIVVALTAQNTYGVQASLPIPAGFIDTQFQSLAADFNIRAAKTGC
ncbi:Hydroxymethylpyrimidine/phosphomethylpyrimidine kinase [Lacticaseibacillus paracasei]|nr:Hydroxymethylpyrimidine/phosphomethylpyrimidine kinase [Lacticaseibacillus paracasei]RNE23746.1 Hydroxymethylpyrimidine/phosphomethylpyrimidine kinase [Lacticaseibacillus paracasei]